MGKGLVNNASNTANQNQAQTSAQTSGFESNAGALQNSAIQQQGVDNNAAFGGYSVAGQNANNMAQTGGFTPDQAAAFTTQGASGIKSTYDILARQAQQNRAKTGGFDSGNEQAEMARDLTSAQSQNTLNNSVALNTMENQNKQAGNAQLLGASSGMAGLFNTETGEVSNLGAQILQAMGINVASQGQQDSSLTSLATSPVANRSILDNLQQIIEMGGSAISAGQSAGIGGG